MIKYQITWWKDEYFTELLVSRNRLKLVLFPIIMGERYKSEKICLEKYVWKTQTIRQHIIVCCIFRPANGCCAPFFLLFFNMASFYGLCSSLHIYMLFNKNQHHYEYNFYNFLSISPLWTAAWVTFNEGGLQLVLFLASRPFLNRLPVLLLLLFFWLLKRASR